MPQLHGSEGLSASPVIENLSGNRIAAVGVLTTVGVFVATVIFGAHRFITIGLGVASLVLLYPELLRRLGVIAGGWLRPSRSGRPDRASVLMGVIVLTGVVLRLRAYLANRALWLDEAYLARSFLDRDLTTLLLTPLASNQSAPPGFIVVAKTATQMFGFNEYSLRLLPLAASIGTLFLAAKLAKHAFSAFLPQAAFVGLLSFSPFLIYYAQEFKQYSLDAFVATAALLIASTGVQRRRPILIGCLVAGMAVFSLPGAVILGVTLALDVISAVERDDFRRSGLALGLGVTGILLHVAYTFSAGTDRASMVRYWEGHSFPPGGSLLTELRWHFEKTLEIAWVGLAHGNIGFTRVGVGEPLIVMLFLGAVAFSLMRRPREIQLAWFVVIVTVLLAQMRLYPIGTRLSLHLVPVLSLLFAAGIDNLRRNSELAQRAAHIGLALVLILPLTNSWERFNRPLVSRDVRAIVNQINSRVAPDDIVVMNRFSRTAFNLYADAGLTNPRFKVHWTSDARGSTASVQEVLHAQGLAGADAPLSFGRVWIAASHRDRELQVAMREAIVGTALGIVCDLRRDGTFVAVLARTQEEQNTMLCDWMR